MCARLIRLFNENYGKKKEIHFSTFRNSSNYFKDDEEFIQEFMEQRCILDLPSANINQNNQENHINKTPLVPQASELIQALVHAEQFMRSSVNSLELLKAVEPDTTVTTRPSQSALDWIRHAPRYGHAHPTVVRRKRRFAQCNHSATPPPPTSTGKVFRTDFLNPIDIPSLERQS